MTQSLAHPSVLPLVLLVALLLAAAVVDFRTLRIPNRLTAATALAGVAVSVWAADAWLPALGWSVAGLCVGGLVMLPMYALRALGAADVKLMAGVGAFLGPQDVLYAIVCVLIAGGLLAVAVSLHRKGLVRMLRNSRDLSQGLVFSAFTGGWPQAGLAPGASVGKMPYALAIAGGTTAFALLRLLPPSV